MRDQARRLGLERASRAADRVNDALTSMVGATSPRLHLELLCARLVAGESPVRLEPASTGAADAAEADSPARPASPLAALVVANREPASPSSATPTGDEDAPPPAAEKPSPPDDATTDDAATDEDDAAPEPAPASESTPEPEPATETPPPSAEAAVDLPAPDAASGDAELLRRRWSEVLGTLERRRVTWVLVSQSAQVARVDGDTVVLAFSSPPLAERFNAGQHAENVALAIRETLGLQVRVAGEPENGSAAPPPTPRSAPAPTRTDPSPAPAPEPEPKAPPRRSAATEDEASDGDAPAPDADLTGADAVAKMLGGTVVDDE
jgi:DNA polymerase-3 subunit gamma/tau